MTLNAALVAPVRPLAAAVNVYPLPARSMRNPVKTATPLLATLDLVPDNVPPEGFVPIATVIVPA